MFDISESGKEIVASYLKETFGNRRIKKREPQKSISESKGAKEKGRFQSLVLAKSLIVKL
ncbi:MAG: hypothetical protein VW455_07975 [Nitrospinota bacterium]